MSVFIEYSHVFKNLDTLSSHSWMPLLTTNIIKLRAVPLRGMCSGQMETNKDDAQQNAATPTLHVFARVRCRHYDPEC